VNYSTKRIGVPTIKIAVTPDVNVTNNLQFFLCYNSPISTPLPKTDKLQNHPRKHNNSHRKECPKAHGLPTLCTTCGRHGRGQEGSGRVRRGAGGLKEVRNAVGKCGRGEKAREVTVCYSTFLLRLSPQDQKTML